MFAPVICRDLLLAVAGVIFFARLFGVIFSTQNPLTSNLSIEFFLLTAFLNFAVLTVSLTDVTVLILGVFDLLLTSVWFGDAPAGVFFEFAGPETPIMEGIFFFNLNQLMVTSGLVVLVGWLVLNTFINFFGNILGKKTKIFHSGACEILWAATPALILLSLGVPSFVLVHSLDDTSCPQLTLKVSGHQWYWSYGNNNHKKNNCAEYVSFKWSSYMLSSESLQEGPNKYGLFRLLEVNPRILLPVGTLIKLLISSVDVLHSWAVPSFGIRVDACPSRMDLASLYMKRAGMFFGQCSEICGVNPRSIPITITGTTMEQFADLVAKELCLGEKHPAKEPVEFHQLKPLGFCSSIRTFVADVSLWLLEKCSAINFVVNGPIPQTEVASCTPQLGGGVRFYGYSYPIPL